jgi:hypothetical protein
MLASPAAWAEDKPKEKPDSPAAQYKALIDEHQAAQQAFFKALDAAKTEAEREKAMKNRPQGETYAPKFLELAEKNPRDPIAFDALTWVVNNDNSSGKDSSRAKALAILRRDHIANEKLAGVCQALGRGLGADQESTSFLREIMTKNPSKAVQAEAALALAQGLSNQARYARMIKENADFAKRVAEFYGKERSEEMRNADAAKVEAEATDAYREFAEKYAGAAKVETIQNLCRMLSFDGSKTSEPLLRALLEKDERRDVQGIACLTLAQVLKSRSDEVATNDPKEAEKLRKESEGLFERAAEKFADVKMLGRGTVADKAKTELYELRFLAVGKQAPEVEGVDQDGKKFKLSDYRGKVVLFDFWSQY